MIKNPFIASFIAGDTIEKNKIVKFDTTAKYVVKNAAETTFGVGISSTDLDAAAGDHVDVIMGGIAEVIAGASITKGQALVADSAGEATPLTTTMENAAAAFVIGYALESADDGDIFSILVQPHRVSKAGAN